MPTKGLNLTPSLKFRLKRVPTEYSAKEALVPQFMETLRGLEKLTGVTPKDLRLDYSFNLKDAHARLGALRGTYNDSKAEADQFRKGFPEAVSLSMLIGFMGGHKIKAARIGRDFGMPSLRK